MKIVIVGYGWLGALLAPQLTAAGHQVFVTSRSQQKLLQLPGGVRGHVLDMLQSEPFTGETIEMFNDAVVLCMIAPGRQEQGNEYVPALQKLRTLLQQAKSLAVIHFSSSGIYQGLDGDVDEDAALMMHLPRVQRLVSGEQVLQQFSCCITLRLAGLMGPGRHPGQFVANKTLTDPQAPINMVHAADISGALQCILAGRHLTPAVFNLSCPLAISRAEFYQQACQSAGTEVSFAAQTLTQRRVLPTRFIRQFHYQFRFLSASDGLMYCH